MMRHDRYTIAAILIVTWYAFMVFVVGGAGR